MSLSNPTFLDQNTLFRPTVNRRASLSPSRSRSPTRQAQFVAEEIDPLLDNLSPDSTLRALTLTDALGKQQSQDVDLLARSIGHASTAERAQGIRAAVAAQKVREWHGELLAWKWPAKKGKVLGKGFEPRQTASEKGVAKDVKEYYGSLPKSVVIQHEERIEEIRDALEALEVDELKAQVLRFHASPSEKPKRASYIVPMSDFTAVITHTILQALPYLFRLQSLLSDWEIRILVLKQIPSILRRLDRTEAIVELAWENVRTRRTSCLLTRQHFKETQAALGHDVSEVGASFDGLLDLLEGRDDSLPEVWIDRMDRLEAHLSNWTAEAERKVLFNEWLKESGSFIVNHSKLQQSQTPNTPNDASHAVPDDALPDDPSLARLPLDESHVFTELPSPSIAATYASAPLPCMSTLVTTAETVRRPVSLPEAREMRGINQGGPKTSAATTDLPLREKHFPHVQHRRGVSLGNLQERRSRAALVRSIGPDESSNHEAAATASDALSPLPDTVGTSENRHLTVEAEGHDRASEQSYRTPPQEPLSLKLPRPVHVRTTSEVSVARSIASEAFSDLSRVEIGSATTAEALGSPKVIRHSIKLSQSTKSSVCESRSRAQSLQQSLQQSPVHHPHASRSSRDTNADTQSLASPGRKLSYPLPVKSSDIVTDSDGDGASPRASSEQAKGESVAADLIRRGSISRPSNREAFVIDGGVVYTGGRRESNSSANISSSSPLEASHGFASPDSPRSISPLPVVAAKSPPKSMLPRPRKQSLKKDWPTEPHPGRLIILGSEEELRNAPALPVRSTKRLPPEPPTKPLPATPVGKTAEVRSRSSSRPSSRPTSRPRATSKTSHRGRSREKARVSQSVSPEPQSKPKGDLLHTRIQSLVTDMSDRVKLLPGSGAGSPRLTPGSSSRPQSPLPPLILSAVQPKRQTGAIYSSAPNSDVRMFHLTRTSDQAGTTPTKLFVRLVGPKGERVMVRVGGGWADLGDYLENYSLHRSGRGRDADEQYELAPLPVSGQKESTDRRVISLGMSSVSRAESHADSRADSRADSHVEYRIESRAGSRAGSRTRSRSRSRAIFRSDSRAESHAASINPHHGAPSTLDLNEPILPTRTTSGLSRRSSASSLRDAFRSVKRRLSFGSLRDRSRNPSPAPLAPRTPSLEQDRWGWNNSSTTTFRPGQIRSFNPYFDNEANWDAKPQRVVIGSSSQSSLHYPKPSRSPSPSAYQHVHHNHNIRPSSPQRGHTSPAPYSHRASPSPTPYSHSASPSPNPNQHSYSFPADPTAFPARKGTLMHNYHDAYAHQRPFTAADLDTAPAPNIGSSSTGGMLGVPVGVGVTLNGRPKARRRSSAAERVEEAVEGVRRMFARRRVVEY